MFLRDKCINIRDVIIISAGDQFNRFLAPPIYNDRNETEIEPFVSAVVCELFPLNSSYTFAREYRSRGGGQVLINA